MVEALKLDKTRLDQMLNEIAKSREVEEGLCQKLSARAAKLSKKLGEIRIKISDLNHREKLIKEALIVVAGIPKALEKLRVEIMEKEARSLRTDILVEESLVLKAEVKELKDRVQDQCNHPFVVSFDGYRGSYSYDFENGHYGSRICAICGFTEQSESVDNDIYKALVEGSCRLIRRSCFLDDTAVLGSKSCNVNSVIIWQPTANIVASFQRQLDRFLGNLL